MTGDSDVQRLQLPLSDWVFEVRADGWWRELSPAQLADELRGYRVLDPDEWVEPDYVDAGMHGRCERWPEKQSPAEGWWLMWAAGPPPKDVRLVGGRRPPVLEFGPLWLCEWRSAWLIAEVIWPNRVMTMFDRRPMFLDPS